MLQHAQMEIVFNFFTGSLDMSETYCDDIRLIAPKYIAAPGGFWFDVATSLPWSFNDLIAYQVIVWDVFASFAVFYEAKVLSVSSIF